MIPKQKTNTISPELLELYNTAQLKNAAKQYTDFQKAFAKGCCSLCGMKLSYFAPEEPCFHWLLLPFGIRKKHLIEYFKNPVGFFQLQSYLRWIASTEEKFRFINDLDPENKLVETTIKYKDIEWSFNLGRTDFNGHKGSMNADFPHFHLQIIKSNMYQLVFNDCHIPLKKHDIDLFNKIESDPDFEHHFFFGEGISVINDENDLKWVDEEMIHCENELEATFHTQSFVEFPDNSEITNDDLNQLLEESKNLKIPFRKYIKLKIPEVDVTTTVSPGPGVVEKKGRNKR